MKFSQKKNVKKLKFILYFQQRRFTKEKCPNLHV